MLISSFLAVATISAQRMSD